MSFAKRPKPDYLSIAKAGWGTVPDWVAVLAQACMRDSQTEVGKRLDYSGATISLVISNQYRGDLKKLEAKVRGALMAETVTCPAINAEMGRDVCQNWQHRPFSTASANAVRMFQACHHSGCPHSIHTKAKEQDAE